MDLLSHAVKFYDIWSNTILYGRISPCIIYFPIKTLISSEVTSIQEALDYSYSINKDLEIFVIQMPIITVQNSSNLQNLNKYTTEFPIQVPETMWQPRKNFFPWRLQLDSLRCWTIQNNETMHMIKSVTWNIAIDVSVKYNQDNEECECGHKNVVMDILGVHDSQRTTEPIYCNNCGSPINALSNLDLRVYVDTPPVQLNISDQQVILS